MKSIFLVLILFSSSAYSEPLPKEVVENIVLKLNGINSQIKVDPCPTPSFNAIKDKNLFAQFMNAPIINEFDICNSNKAIIYQDKKENKTELVLSSKGNNLQSIEVTLGGYSENYLSFSPSCEQILVLEKNNNFRLKNIALLNSDEHFQIDKSLGGINGFSWKDKETILIFTPQKIFEFNILTKKINMLYETSDEINKVTIDKSSNPSDIYFIVNNNVIKKIVSKKESVEIKKIEGNIHTLTVSGGKVLISHAIDSSSFHVLTKIFSTNGREELSLFGSDPKFINNSTIILSKFNGSNESIPYKLNLISKKESTPLGTTFTGKVLQTKISGEAICFLTNSNFVQNQISCNNNTNNLKITDLESKGLILTDSVKTERIQLHGTDGVDRVAYLHLPKDGNIKKTIVYVHGGGCHGSQYDSSYPELEFAKLMEQNIAILAISYRGDFLASEQVGNSEPKERSFEQCGTDETDDLFTARDYLKKKYPSAQAYLWGHSHGAFLTNLAVTRDAKKGKWDGVITTNGMWDIKKGGGGYFGSKEEAAVTEIDGDIKLQTIPLEADQRFPIYSESPPIIGEEKARAKFKELKAEGKNFIAVRFQFSENYYQERNPIEFVKSIQAPVLIRHGKKDQSISFDHADIFLEKAKEYKLNFKASISEEGHSPESEAGFEQWEKDLHNFLFGRK